MERPCTSMGAARQRVRRVPPWTVLLAAAHRRRKLRAAAAVRFVAFRVTRSPLTSRGDAAVSTDKDYEAGRYNQPFRAGGDWDAYRQGQAIATVGISERRSRPRPTLASTRSEERRVGKEVNSLVQPEP